MCHVTRVHQLIAPVTNPATITLLCSILAAKMPPSTKYHRHLVIHHPRRWIRFRSARHAETTRLPYELESETGF